MHHTVTFGFALSFSPLIFIDFAFTDIASATAGDNNIFQVKQ